MDLRLTQNASCSRLSAAQKVKNAQNYAIFALDVTAFPVADEQPGACQAPARPSTMAKVRRQVGFSNSTSSVPPSSSASASRTPIPPVRPSSTSKRTSSLQHSDPSVKAPRPVANQSTTKAPSSRVSSARPSSSAEVIEVSGAVAVVIPAGAVAFGGPGGGLANFGGVIVPVPKARPSATRPRTPSPRATPRQTPARDAAAQLHQLGAAYQLQLRPPAGEDVWPRGREGLRGLVRHEPDCVPGPDGQGARGGLGGRARRVDDCRPTPPPTTTSVPPAETSAPPPPPAPKTLFSLNEQIAAGTTACFPTTGFSTTAGTTYGFSFDVDAGLLVSIQTGATDEGYHQSKGSWTGTFYADAGSTLRICGTGAASGSLPLVFTITEEPSQAVAAPAGKEVFKLDERVRHGTTSCFPTTGLNIQEGNYGFSYTTADGVVVQIGDDSSGPKYFSGNRASGAGLMYIDFSGGSISVCATNNGGSEAPLSLSMTQ
ncbi:alkaline serine protease [Colletotrichum tofieldiae]|nr:alkaline serine protease [Colletotrichum tofieldiae]